jgi:hypothetical protein
MVVRTTLASVTCSTAVAGSIPAFPAFIGPDDQATTATASVSADNQFPVADQYSRYTYNYVTSTGELVNQSTATAANFVRYCEYPGERLFRKVSFEVNGNPLDSYESDSVVFFRKFRVPPGKLVGWQRLMGQEVPVPAVSQNFSELTSAFVIQQAVNASTAGISGLTTGGATSVNGAAGAIVSPQLANQIDTSRRQLFVLNGAQTPKATQPALELWIPLLNQNRQCLIKSQASRLFCIMTILI